MYCCLLFYYSHIKFCQLARMFAEVLQLGAVREIYFISTMLHIYRTDLSYWSTPLNEHPLATLFLPNQTNSNNNGKNVTSRNALSDVGPIRIPMYVL